MRGWIAGLIAAILSTVIGGLILSAIQTPPVPVPATRAPHPDPNPTTPPTLSLSRSSGPPGTALSVSGGGFAPGERVRLRFHSTELVSVTANGEGAFSGASVRVPVDWKFKGQFLIIASGETSVRSVSEPFQVT